MLHTIVVLYNLIYMCCIHVCYTRRLRRVKSQVSLSLPSKKEYTLLVPLTDKQKALYKLVLGALDASAVRALFGQGDGEGADGEGGGVKVTDYRSGL